jgi:hypothetical protein
MMPSDRNSDKKQRSGHVIELSDRVDVITEDAARTLHAYEFERLGGSLVMFDKRLYKALRIPSWSPKPPHKPTEAAVELLTDAGFEISEESDHAE